MNLIEPKATKINGVCNFTHGTAFFEIFLVIFVTLCFSVRLYVSF